MSALRTVGRAFLVAPFVFVGAWVWLGPPTFEGGLFGLALLIACGAFVARRRSVALGALAVAASLVLARLLFAAEGAQLRAQDGWWVDRVLPERDVALGASRLLLLAGVVDEPGMLDALRRGYDRLRDHEGWVPSPALSTLVHDPTPDDFTTLEIPGPRDDAAVVFLHGSMGSVTVACWQVSRAASTRGLTTVCPSTDLSGRWDRAGGRAILDVTLRRLSERGVRRVVIVGLSAGGIGLSRLAPRLRLPPEMSLAGIVQLSGTAAPAHPRRVRTLVLQGGRDTMTPPGPARRHARSLGSLGELVEIPEASHWLLLSHPEAVDEALGAFFERTLPPS
ncbi:MAG: alpha/beta hydrolase [Polyangiales bacterium]